MSFLKSRLPHSCQMWHNQSVSHRPPSHSHNSSRTVPHQHKASLVKIMLFVSIVRITLFPTSLFSLLYLVLKDTTLNKSFAVQYSMYLNVCCAININVYYIFYNTEEADLIVQYDSTKWTYRKKRSSKISLPTICMFVVLLIYMKKALKGSLWYVEFTWIHSLLCARQNKNNVDVKFSIYFILFF